MDEPWIISYSAQDQNFDFDPKRFFIRLIYSCKPNEFFPFLFKS